MDDSPWGDVPSQSESASKNATQDDRSSSGALSPSLQQSTSSLRSPTTRGGKTRKVAQPTRLEAVDGTLDPLGPLGAEPSGDAFEEPGPTPPRKETAARTTRPISQQNTSLSQSMLSSVDLNDDGGDSVRGKLPPPVQPPQSGDGPKRQTQPSVSIEQAAKPTFDITVGDPHKVGDITSSHIVYQVRTKTTSKAYRQPEFAVSRRYRDFLWLYNQLHSNNPGVVVPPPPEKQAVGRFDTNFVESRRAALERMLNKTAAHPILQHDGDLKIFLESEAFNVDVKNKENREPDLGQTKGMFSSLGIGGGGSGKFIEHDDWFHDRKVYLDALENQLKALMRSVDTVISQRKVLAESAGEFSNALNSLSLVELSPLLSGPLAGLSDVQLRIRELYDRQAQQDVLTLGITVDEYIRLIGSIKTAFGQRQKAFHSWHAAEEELRKRKAAQDKLLRQGKSQQDKINQINADVADAERRVHQARLLFEDMGRLMRSELERFEREKVEDFKSGVETFLESAVEAQKELIELWETFLLQLDAEDDDQPFYKPPIQPATTGEATAGAKANDPDEADTTAAATVTAEQDD